MRAASDCFDQTSLPQGAQRLLALATAVPERQDARREAARLPPGAAWTERPQQRESLARAP